MLALHLIFLFCHKHGHIVIANTTTNTNEPTLAPIMMPSVLVEVTFPLSIVVLESVVVLSVKF